MRKDRNRCEAAIAGDVTRRIYIYCFNFFFFLIECFELFQLLNVFEYLLRDDYQQLTRPFPILFAFPAPGAAPGYLLARNSTLSASPPHHGCPRIDRSLNVDEFLRRYSSPLVIERWPSLASAAWPTRANVTSTNWLKVFYPFHVSCFHSIPHQNRMKSS